MLLCCILLSSTVTLSVVDAEEVEVAVEVEEGEADLALLRETLEVVSWLWPAEEPLPLLLGTGEEVEAEEEVEEGEEEEEGA